MKKLKEISVSKDEIVSLDIFLPLLAFLIPILISGPQIITGTLVNCLLFLSATQSSKKITSMTIVLPSIGALTHGVLFGQFTPFLFYFLPFIWLGNYLLILGFAKTYNKFSSPTAIVTSSVLKFLVIYFSALLYFNFQIVPKLFLSSMGLIQLLTAIFGGTVALSISKLIKHSRG